MLALVAALACALLAGGCGGGGTPQAVACGNLSNRVETFRVEAFGITCQAARRAVRQDVSPAFWFETVRTAWLGNDGNFVATPIPTTAQRQAHKRFMRLSKARDRAAARARAGARAAYIRATNRWHRGYQQQDGNVYWRWRDLGYCNFDKSQYCWTVEVITRNGCPSYVGVNANEYSGGGAVINDFLDNQGSGIPPKTRRIFFLGPPDGENTTLDDVTVDCE
ncbi:MAG: hypothetical protein ACXVRS_13660 [Gaiellaceae bacterium]